jgi:hypothetical protein
MYVSNSRPSKSLGAKTTADLTGVKHVFAMIKRCGALEVSSSVEG